MTLHDNTVFTTDGDLVLDGTAAEKTCLEDGIIRPPKFKKGNTSRVVVLGNLGLIRVAEVAVDDENGPGVPVELLGDFDNRIIFEGEEGEEFAECFDWRNGGLLLSGPGDAEQLFEVAGVDRGPEHDPFQDGAKHNFEIGSLEIASEANVTFQDAFENNNFGDCEALYVETLTLRPEADVTIVNCKVYYQELVDEGGEVIVERGDCSGFLPNRCKLWKKLTAKCTRNRTVKVKVRFKDRSLKRETVTIGIGQARFDVEIRGRTAKLNECCFEGKQVVSLLDPPGCVEPKEVECR